MNQLRRASATTIALYAIAALLLANLVAVMSQGGSRDLLPAAFAQRQAPIAGGAGVFIMPAQLSGNTWGCYLLDVDTGTLCVYQFYPGSSRLQFIAARDFRADRRLRNYNTTPSPDEIQQWVEKAMTAPRGMGEGPQPSESTTKEVP